MTNTNDIDAQKKAIRRVVSIFGCALMFCGVLTMAGTIWAYYSGEESRNWPSVDGVIMSSKVERYEKPGVNGSLNGAVSYEPGITYKYTINRTEYSNDRVSYSPIGGSDRRSSQYYVSRFVVGNTYPVFYDSGNPERSTLTRGTSTLNGVAIFSGALFFLFGLVMYKMREVYANSIPDDSDKG